jgi:phage/plasmid-associated DNA primase
MPVEAPTARSAAAFTYGARGWSVVPVRPRSKQPFNPDRRDAKGWQQLRPGAADLDRWFAASDLNLGLLMGEPSGGLVDIDLDATEAVAAAETFLPPTDCVFGRPTKPRSHWFYVCLGAATRKFKDPTDQSMLVELRSDGCMTVVPPSVHPTGEQVAWSHDDAPALVEADQLVAAVESLAAAALLARHWPAPGGRHDAQLTVTAFLTRVGWTDTRVAGFLQAVSGACGGDPDPAKRRATAKDAAKRMVAGLPLRGFPTLVETFGEPVARRVADWLRIGDFGTCQSPVAVDADAADGEVPTLLKTGSAVELARRLMHDLNQQHGGVIHADGAFWRWNTKHWLKLPAPSVRSALHALDGAALGKSTRAGPSVLVLQSHQITGAIQELEAMCAQPRFFDAPPLGINVIDGFLELATNGDLVLKPHHQDQRQTSLLETVWSSHAVKSKGLHETPLDALVAKLFPDPQTLQVLGDLLGEIVGVAALGAARKLRTRKAVILYGPSQHLISATVRLIRGMTPEGRAQAISLLQLAKDPYAVLLRTAFLNALDEVDTGPFPLERFSAAIACDPLTGKHLYEAPEMFSPQALFVLGARTAPEALASAPAPLHERLLILPLAGESGAAIVDLVETLLATDQAALLGWAAAGAARAIKRGALAEPTPCHKAAAEWRADGDPVAAWLADPEAVAIDSTASVGRTLAFSAFRAWCERLGIGNAPAYTEFRRRVLQIGGGVIQEARTGRTGRTFRGLRCGAEMERAHGTEADG